MTKKRIFLGFILLVVLGLLAGSLLLKKAATSNRRYEDVENHIASFPAPLRRDRFTEDFLERNIVRGLSLEEAEAILGKPYRYAEFMGTMRASYLLENSNVKGLNLSGFTVVYKEKKVGQS